jgi:hypothetical protein
VYVYIFTWDEQRTLHSIKQFFALTVTATPDFFVPHWHSLRSLPLQKRAQKSLDFQGPPHSN